MTASALAPPHPLHRNSIMEEDDDSGRLQQARSQRSIIVFDWMNTCAAGLFSTCEGNCIQSTRQSGEDRNETLHRLDYAQLHDHFLESLLQEAASPSTAGDTESEMEAIATRIEAGIPDDSDSSSLSRKRKRRLPRLRNKNQNENSLLQSPTKQPNDSHSQQVPPGEPYDPFAPPPLLPAHFLHDHVRMQKDKGKGEEPGSMICVKGKDATLDKLNVKMQLLCNTAIQEKGASMKRRPARIAVHLNNFVETRSILEVRLGFLSMMYGILLRWDTNITGKITLVVLRKMCHESFYPRKAVAAPLSISTSGSSAEEENANPSAKRSSKDRPLSPRVVEGKAIVDWPDGTEVSILDPPYLVSRPGNFKPTTVTVSTLHVSGLDRKSTWMVQFVLDLQVFSVNLVYDDATRRFVPKSDWRGVTYVPKSLDAVLDIKLLQLRSRRRKCAGTMHVPLANLPALKDPATHLTFPCKDATLDIDIYLESEFLIWTQSELEARRKASSFFRPRSTKPMPASPPPMVVDTDEEEEDDDAWGWILCYMC